MNLSFAFLDTDLSVVKTDRAVVPDAVPVFFARTEDENSLVCPTASVPSEGVLEREDGWLAFRICGQLDFSLIGILSRVSAALADAGVGIFAVSTYDTDYVLFKKEKLNAVRAALSELGTVS